MVQESEATATQEARRMASQAPHTSTTPPSGSAGLME